ncbi:hypothetical protein DFH05DRAFT_1458484 [Lentinula detonsa]|uniref:Uncharacterized protein n=1 Tax=Lentinula detonsa TaxID=2804962 RepID=A0A9W8P3K4_9AGAR|nr:hypothetical protein DFH05DRAFT_1458484 [Lentinula detonsa]
MKLAQNIVLISIMMGAMGAAIPSPAEEEAKRSSIPREESDTVFTWSPMKARDESDIVFTRSPMKVREDPVSDNIFTWSNLGARRVEVLERRRGTKTILHRPSGKSLFLVSLECLQIEAMSSFDEQYEVQTQRKILKAEQGEAKK